MPEQRADLLDHQRCARVLTCEEPQLYEAISSGSSSELVLVPFAGEVDRGVVGVARLYDEPFDQAEVALLEAVVESVRHAGTDPARRARCPPHPRACGATGSESNGGTTRTPAAHHRDDALRPAARAHASRAGPIREIVTADTAVILLIEGAEAALVLRAAAGADTHVDATVELAQRAGVSRRVVREHRSRSRRCMRTMVPDEIVKRSAR